MEQIVHQSTYALWRAPNATKALARGRCPVNEHRSGTPFCIDSMDCCIFMLSQGQFYEQAQVGAALWQLNLSQIAINGRLHHLLIH